MGLGLGLGFGLGFGFGVRGLGLGLGLGLWMATLCGLTMHAQMIIEAARSLSVRLAAVIASVKKASRYSGVSSAASRGRLPTKTWLRARGSG